MFNFANYKIYIFFIISLLSVIVFVYIKFILKIEIFSNEIYFLENYLKNDLLFFVIIFFFFTVLQVFLIPGSILTFLISTILNGYLTFILMFMTGLLAAFIQYKYAYSFNINPISKIEKRIDLVSKKIRNKGFFIITLLRVLPGIPFSTFNLTCGILKINLYYFILSFVIGIGPKILLYSNIFNLYSLFFN
ncbi:VTT domain-containing protein [Pelagibacteraceae bacterium]|nr:VTT domain-containing protein [Pelagibacteraceae bacterium]